MNATLQSDTTIWLNTNDPVVALNASMRNHLPVVAEALRHGVGAIPDLNRQGFFEIEISRRWYYIHIPARSNRIYLVATRERSASLRKPA